MPGYNDKVHWKSQFSVASEGEFAFKGTTCSDWQAWQAAFRPRLRALLGLDVIAEQTRGFVPHAKQGEIVDCGDYLRESWHLWVEPDVPLPFYLLKPKGVNGPLPLVLTPHGHNRPHIYVGLANNPEEEASIRDGERDIAVQAVREGYWVIAPTTRAFGETRTTEDIARDALSSCRIQFMHDVLVGRTPIGDRVWDISCLIDWALANLDVDASRIAITGNSGGGTVSLFAAACEERITVAVPAGYFNTFQGSIGAMHHCDCNYVPGILQLGEMPDVAGLIAPRPFRSINGALDTIFPIEHTKAAFAHLQRIYAAAGVPDQCSMYIGEGGHRYYKDGAWDYVRSAFAGLD